MMKVITFFSQKGGVGKTTLSMLFSSWLAYEEGQKVMVYDFDAPYYPFAHVRATDQALMPMPSAYPVRTVKGPKAGGYSQDELASIVGALKKVKAENDGYMVLDLPGSFLPYDPVVPLTRNGVIDLFVFPITSDRQTTRSARMLITGLLRKPGFLLSESGKESQDVLCLWNMETTRERTGTKDWYAPENERFDSEGIPVAKIRVHSIDSLRRDTSSVSSGFLRSTVVWPSVYVKRSAPYLPELFSEIRARLDGKMNSE